MPDNDKTEKAERKFVEDKVYLKGPNGQIWDYDPLLANVNGYTSHIPNPSKKAAKAAKTDDTDKQNAQQTNKQETKSTK